MRAPKYIRERRATDPRWVRRNKRSLGRNKEFRACVRMDHEARELIKKIAKDKEQKQSSLASIITHRLSEFLNNSARILMPHRAKA